MSKSLIHYVGPIARADQHLRAAADAVLDVVSMVGVDDAELQARGRALWEEIFSLVAADAPRDDNLPAFLHKISTYLDGEG